MLDMTNHTLTMEDIAMANEKEFMQEYINAFKGATITDELLDKYIGDQELKEHVRVFGSAFPGYEIVMNEMIHEGKKMAVRGTLRGKHQGELMGIPPTGKDVSISLMIIYEIENNKIVNHWMVADQFALMQQLGVIN